jgi:hypothetical protein
LYVDLKYKPKENNLIHIWDFPVDATYVKLKENFISDTLEIINKKFLKRQQLINTLEIKIKEDRVDCNAKNSFYTMIKMHLVNLWFLVTLAKLLNISLREVENNILSYRSRKGNIWIEPVKLPIETNAVFDMIVAHLYCDGNESKSSGGRYTQENQLTQNRFKQKLEYAFGKFNSKSTILYKSYIPEIIIRIIKKYYSIDEFSSYYGRIPEKIKNKQKPNRIAVLIAALIDEGEISDNIAICLGNKKLLQDFQDICLSLNYKVSSIKKKGRGFRFYLYSRRRLLDDINNLISYYPCCDLAHKMKDLKFRVSIEGNKSRRWHETEENILKILENNDKITSKELSNALFMTRSSINRTLRNLQIQNKIKSLHLSGKKGGYNYWIKNR